jgi:hypothetical protein
MEKVTKKIPEIEEGEQTDGNEFARFDELTRRLMSVPKKEIDALAAEHKKRKVKTHAKKK